MYLTSQQICFKHLSCIFPTKQVLLDISCSDLIHIIIITKRFPLERIFFYDLIQKNHICVLYIWGIEPTCTHQINSNSTKNMFTLYYPYIHVIIYIIYVYIVVVQWLSIYTLNKFIGEIRGKKKTSIVLVPRGHRPEGHQPAWAKSSKRPKPTTLHRRLEWIRCDLGHC